AFLYAQLQGTERARSPEYERHGTESESQSRGEGRALEVGKDAAVVIRRAQRGRCYRNFRGAVWGVDSRDGLGGNEINPAESCSPNTRLCSSTTDGTRGSSSS